MVKTTGKAGKMGFDARSLGLELQDLNSETRIRFGIPDTLTSGVVIAAIQPDSSASNAGLVQGDVILQANRTETCSKDDFHSVIGRLRKTGNLMLWASRNNTHFFTVLVPR